MAYVKEEEETDQTGVEEFAPQAPAPMGGAPAPVEGAAPTPTPQAPAASGTATWCTRRTGGSQRSWRWPPANSALQMFLD